MKEQHVAVVTGASRIVGRAMATRLGTRDYVGFVGSADIAQEAVEAIADAEGWTGTTLVEVSSDLPRPDHAAPSSTHSTRARGRHRARGWPGKARSSNS
jgi:NAD(P)-dependent dehydrogenase (short-subunit alcohol dehydrogenase family)